jgi:ribosomal protein L40E
MTEDTDERGMPLAKLSRGTILSLPTAVEIEAFRAEQRGEAPPPRESEMLTLDCRICGTKNATFATTCSACSGQLRASAEPEPAAEEDSGPDAATILMQAAGFVTHTKPEDSDDS